MASADEHFLHEVLLTLFHTCDSSSATVLCLVLCQRHTLDIAVVCESYHALLLWDEVLDINFTADVLNACAAVVAELLAYLVQILNDYLIYSVNVCKDILKVRYLGEKSVQLVGYLLSFQTCELS